MIARTVLAMVVLTTIVLTSAPVTAAAPKPLTAEEIALATKLSLESPEAKSFKATVADDPLHDKNYLVSIQAVQSSKKDSDERLAVVIRYQYLKQRPGLTVRSTIDLKSAKVIKHEVLENYPTTLSDVEVADAVKLARRFVKSVEEMYTASGAKVLAKPLVAVVANSKAPSFGHRVVYLTFEVDGKAALPGTIVVDLTAETASQTKR